MPSPLLQISAQIYIHAATTAVWNAFQQVDGWQRWQPQLISAGWSVGEPWQEGSQLQVQRRALFGLSIRSRAVVRMSLPGHVVVLESRRPALISVDTVRFSDEIGGCQISARTAYHGPGAVLLALLQKRQTRALQQALDALKKSIEGAPRR